ncbi:MAG: PH domain-containing protein [Xanthobacteraceae bacterium]
MSYVRSVVQPGEKIIAVGRLSWIVYHRAIAFVLIGVVLVILERLYSDEAWLIVGTGAVLAVAAMVSAIHAWFIRWTTEIAVTDKRVIYKCGFVRRHTVEMNMDKVATVDVDQSILGRLLDYGSIRIVGTGGAPGIERLDRVARPLSLRTAIEVR